MIRMPSTAAGFAGLAAALLGVGCDAPDPQRDPVLAMAQPAATPSPARPEAPPPPGNRRRLDARDLVRGLERSGLEVTDMGPALISIDDSSRFPEESRSTLLLRVSDGRGNSAPMTFVEFGSWKVAAEVDAKPINGFAVRNWFVLGTASTYFVDRVTDALGDA